jgi:hypothetical protein
VAEATDRKDGFSAEYIEGFYKPGEAVEDVHYQVGETKSGPAVLERVSEVDVGVLAGGFIISISPPRLCARPTPSVT